MPSGLDTPNDPRRQPVILNKPKLYAMLVTEPFHVSIQDIARLTDYQIFVIYFWPRKKDGSLGDLELSQKFREVANIAMLKSNFWEVGLKCGWTETQIAASWSVQFPGMDV